MIEFSKVLLSITEDASSNFNFQIILNIVSLLAFAISLYNFFSDKIYNRKNFKISIIDYSRFLSETHLYLSIVNYSRLPISIEKLFIALDNGENMECFYAKKLVMETTTTHKSNSRIVEEIYSDSPPIQVSGLGAVKSLLRFGPIPLPSGKFLNLIIHTSRGKESLILPLPVQGNHLKTLM